MVEVHSLDEFPGAPEVEETGTTFIENAVLKAESAATFTRCAALADDSGLEVAALGGAPGVCSSRFSGPAATDSSNCAKLLQMLRNAPPEARNARFVCAVAVAIPGRPTWTAEGLHEGQILEAPRGTLGFGYDPLFFSYELGATFTEVPAEVKNEVSHRARAMAQAERHQRDVLTKGG